MGFRPELEMRAVMRGTYNGRAVNAADALDAQMSGQFAGRMMTAATADREVLSPDRQRRDMTGVHIEGIGPAAFDMHQRVVERSPTHSRIEFQADNGLLNGRFYQDFDLQANGDVVMTEKWNKDDDSRIMSMSGMAPKFIAAVHNSGVKDQFENIAKKLNGRFVDRMPQQQDVRRDATKSPAELAALDEALGNLPGTAAQQQLRQEMKKCADPVGGTGRSLQARRFRTGAVCDYAKVQRLRQVIASQQQRGRQRRAFRPLQRGQREQRGRRQQGGYAVGRRFAQPRQRQQRARPRPRPRQVYRRPLSRRAMSLNLQ